MNFQSTSAEMELLLCCARAHLDGQTLERIQVLLRQSVDWQHLIRNAFAHGVMPLLYRSLQQSCREVVPQVYLDRLRDHFRANVQRNLSITAELLKLISLLENQKIKVIPFKGPVLAALAYRDLSLRQFGDLDILVHKQDIPKAGSLLVSQGYRSGSEHPAGLEHDFDPEKVAYVGPKFYIFVHPGRRIIVDLQWRVTEQYFSFSLDRDALWSRLVPVSLAGRTVITFAPADLLLILCVHGSKHRWEKLKWICDVAELVRVYKEEIDWMEVKEEASRQAVERMLALGLFLAQEFLGTTLPNEVSKQISKELGPQSGFQQIRERLFAQTDEPRRKIEKVIFYLRTKDGWRDRFQFCFYYLSQCVQAIVTPTTKEQRVLPLPVPLYFLYYFFRPFRLTVKYGLLGLVRLYKGNSPRQ